MANEMHFHSNELEVDSNECVLPTVLKLSSHEHGPLQTQQKQNESEKATCSANMRDHKSTIEFD